MHVKNSNAVHIDNNISVRIRLVADDSIWNGRVEVRYLQDWGTVCDLTASATWGEEESRAVCSQLGFGGGQKVAAAPGTSHIWLKDVTCSGSEEALTECLSNTTTYWGDADDCVHAYDVGVQCDPPAGLFTNKYSDTL